MHNLHRSLQVERVGPWRSSRVPFAKSDDLTKFFAQIFLSRGALAGSSVVFGTAIGCVVDPAGGDDAHEMMITCPTKWEWFTRSVGDGGGRDGWILVVMKVY